MSGLKLLANLLEKTLHRLLWLHFLKKTSYFFANKVPGQCFSLLLKLLFDAKIKKKTSKAGGLIFNLCENKAVEAFQDCLHYTGEKKVSVATTDIRLTTLHHRRLVASLKP